MKKTIFLFFSLALCFNAYSQFEEKMKKYDVIKGAIFKKGKTIDGYIKQSSNIWKFQFQISFIPKDKFESIEKIRNKHFTTYKPNKCDGYRYGSVLTYVSAKYADISQGVSLSSLPRKFFIRKVMDGEKISFYAYDPVPTDLTNIQDTWLLFKKNNKKLAKSIAGMSVKKQLAACPEIVKKFSEDGYNPKDFKLGKKWGLKLSDPEKTRVLAIFEYNKSSCKK